jgi:hypothetical protein
MILAGWLTLLIVSWQAKQKERQMKKIEDTLPVWAQYVLGGILMLIVIGFLWAMFAQIAQATEFGPDGVCVQDDGQLGRGNGTTSDDAGCITESEYEALYNPPALVDAGVLEDFVENGDGTITGRVVTTGAFATMIWNPLDRPVAATSRLEPNAPTVREILFSFRPLTWR